MKKLTSLLLCLIILLSVTACDKAPAAEGGDLTDDNKPAQTEIEKAHEWMDRQIENNTLFSFKYDGAEYSSFISQWEKTVEDGTNADGAPVKTVTYKSPEGVRAWIEISFDEEFAAYDWCCYFKNEGSGDSPVISEIQALSSGYELENAELTTANGCTGTEFDFQPVFVDLTSVGKHTMRSSSGRSSDGAFPYFDICNGEQGIICAIGWTGNWVADFEYTEGVVNMKAGMAETCISLHKDEDMRTPSMVMIFFNGDSDTGHNCLRRLILKSYTPDDENGETMTHLPFGVNAYGAAGQDTIDGYLDIVERTNLRYDMLWVDAGWYGDKISAVVTDNKWFSEAGNWYVNETLYPNGFKDIDARLESTGHDLLVWFEPERAGKGTKLLTEHPDYFLPKSEASNVYIYDFGNDEACDYMIDLIDGIIKENGIDWYRQDCNTSMYESWRYADNQQGENRIGITEINHITNLYRFIDTLLERNPGLRMDNCAAGGRRLDIEMMKRSVPLWRADYSSNTAGTVCDGTRNINYNLTWWLPLSGGGRAADGLGNSYQWRCLMGSGITAGRNVVGSRNQRWYFRMIDQYMECREMMTGDYYILSAGWNDQMTTKNAVYEFYTPETGLGYIVAFRPSGSKVDSDTYVLKGLEPDAVYQLEAVDTGETGEFTGEQLMVDGLKLNFIETMESQLIYITRK